MPDGNSTFLKFLVGVDTEGESKLDKLKQKYQNIGSDVKETTDEMKEHTDGFRESLGMTSDSADEASSSFMRLTGQGLALLFAGRFLSKTFGSINRSMMNMVGIGDIVSGTMKGVMAPAFATLVEPVSRLSAWFLDLDDTTQNMIAAFVGLMAAAGLFLTIVGQVQAGLAAFGLTLGALATPIGVAVGALAILYAGFRFGMALVNNFDSAIDGMVSNLRSAFSMVLNIVRGDWSAAWDDFEDIIDTTVGWVKDFLQDFLGDTLYNLLINAASTAYEGARQIGEDIVGGMVDAIRDLGSNIEETVNDYIPGGMGTGQNIMSMATGIGSPSSLVSRVNDFVMTGDGRVLKTHPNDTIIGTKEPQNLGGNGGGDTIVIRDPTVTEDKDIDDIVREVEKVLDRNSRGRGVTR